MKCWIKAKFRQVLQLLGLKPDDDWYMLRAVINICGQKKAEAVLAKSVCLQLDHPWQWHTKRVIEATPRKNIQEESPEFDDCDFEPILEWGNAKVEPNYWPRTNEHRGYTLRWAHRFIDLEVKEEEQARKAAALFIYMWTRDIYAGVAERAAVAYVRTWEVRQI